MKHPQVTAEEDWQNGGFGLYVHWPFCASKCPYCDFNSHVSLTIDHKSWRSAYVSEVNRVAKLTPGRTLDSIFFGGGTPSTMEPETVTAIIEAAKAAWPTRNSLEITLEANPASVDYEKFRDFSAAGVSRVSLGVQALDDDALRLLGRRHSANEALKAWSVARSVFDRTNIDLIYARQHQSLQQWERELKDALSFNPSHMSLYQLTVENGTAFGDRYRVGKLPGLPSSDEGADLYEITQSLCEAAGLSAYEVSNHAKQGEESLHNLIYWRYGDYVGIGPGAHGRVTLDGKKFATECVKAPGAWLKSALSPALSQETSEVLTGQDQATEYMMMSLRLSEGSDLGRFERLGGAKLDTDRLAALIDDKLLWADRGRIGTTPTGRQLLNAILAEIL